MSSFIPQNLTHLLAVIVVLISVVGIGYLITKIGHFKTAAYASWSLTLLATILIERLVDSENPGFRMISIILVMLFAIKTIVVVEWYKGSQRGLSFTQWLAFVIGWFGMRPQLFEDLGKTGLPGGRPLIILGIKNCFIGAVVLLLSKWLAVNFDAYLFKILISCLILTGISLILHFGILNISAGIWRYWGVDTRTLFRSPLQSNSLREFWGKRWNIAFSEMTSIAVYRPLKLKWGITLSTLTAFLFSGLLHEMAISVPVKMGFGLPLIYFLIHGLLMMVEKEMEKKGYSLNTYPWLGRCWVLFWLILPLPLLFHKGFMVGIIWPVIGM